MNILNMQEERSNNMKRHNVVCIWPMISFDEFDGAMHRMLLFARLYKDAGYDVTVIAGFPFSIGNCKKAWVKNNKIWISGVNFYYIPHFSWLRHIIGRRISYMLMGCSLWFISRKHNATIIHTETYQGGALLRFKSKTSLGIVDFHGDIIDETLYKFPELKQDHPDIDYLTKMTCDAVKYSDIQIIVNPKMKDLLEKQTSRSLENVFTFPCLSDNKRFDVEKTKTLDHLKDRIVIGYFGGLQKWQNIDFIIDLIIQLRKLNQSIFFMLLTNHDISSYAEKLNSIGANNYYIKSVPSVEIPSYVKAMDVSCLIRDNRMLNQVSSPTKICESMSAGVPMIATRYAGDIEEIIKAGGEVYILEDCTLKGDDLTKIIHWLKKIKSSKIMYSDRCRASVATRNWESFSRQYLSYIDRCSNKC